VAIQEGRHGFRGPEARVDTVGDRVDPVLRETSSAIPRVLLRHAVDELGVMSRASRVMFSRSPSSRTVGRNRSGSKNSAQVISSADHCARELVSCPAGTGVWVVNTHSGPDLFQIVLVSIHQLQGQSAACPSFM
jgi:hypothetical protein